MAEFRASGKEPSVIIPVFIELCGRDFVAAGLLKALHMGALLLSPALLKWFLSNLGVDDAQAALLGAALVLNGIAAAFLWAFCHLLRAWVRFVMRNHLIDTCALKSKSRRASGSRLFQLFRSLFCRA